MSEDLLTQENRDFIEEIIQDKRNSQITLESPLALAELQTNEWNPFTRRVGLIARKIGNYPLWSKEGKKYQTTLLQVTIFILLLLVLILIGWEEILGKIVIIFTIYQPSSDPNIYHDYIVIQIKLLLFCHCFYIYIFIFR